MALKRSTSKPDSATMVCISVACSGVGWAPFSDWAMAPRRWLAAANLFSSSSVTLAPTEPAAEAGAEARELLGVPKRERSAA